MSDATRSPALDAGAFAEQLLGQPLWSHQLDLVRSPARFRICLAGRQAGKSRALAVLALHTAATKRNAMVLLVSAGETASRRLLEECAALASASPLLAGSVVDESRSQLTLSNGSRILSVPASQRQIRGWSIDLLIIDEAAFIDPSIWQAAEPSIVARPGSRVVLCSTPWGMPDHFFRVLFRRGMDAPDEMVASFHWPSSLSPLVDDVLLEHWRATWPAIAFQQEVLAEFADNAGSYFTTEELDACVADYELLDVDGARAVSPVNAPPVLWAVGGLDWGVRKDANAIVLVSPMDDGGANAERLGPRGRALFVPYIAAEYHWQWDEFAAHVAEVCSAYYVQVLASELNGPGDAATRMLELEMRRQRTHTSLFGVWTDMRRKQAAFGKIKLLLQRGLLVLPRHPELLKQLRALEFEQSPSGGVRISVPESQGHDDAALALAQAVSCVSDPEEWGFGGALGLRERRSWVRAQESRGPGQVIGSGLWVPERPLPVRRGDVPSYWMGRPQGEQRGEAW